MKISAQFVTSLHSPEHIATAERLGYDRAWLFDTPHESPDVWMMLALAAQRTTTIGLGPGVLVPTLRHPMVTRWRHDRASTVAAMTQITRKTATATLRIQTDRSKFRGSGLDRSV
jgi:Luciferase-like monooxygenase